LLYPLTAPSVNPLIRYFLSSNANIKTGAMSRTPEALGSPHMVSLADVGRKTVVATVAGLAFIPARTSPSRNSFHERMKRSILVAMTPGAARGKEILRNAPSLDSPTAPHKMNKGIATAIGGIIL